MKKFKYLFKEMENPDLPSRAAMTYKEKPNKEPMKKLKEENDTTEKVEMVQSQLHFIKYACEEILEYIDDGGEIEEWYQVKVAKSFSEFESLHAYIEGESRRTGMKEDVEKEKQERFANYRAGGKRSSDQRLKDMLAGQKNIMDLAVQLKKQRDANHRTEEVDLDEGQNPQVKGGDPCWKGYEMVGMKKKGGKDVPNCVPVKEQKSDDVPFDGPYKRDTGTVTDKSGAKHTPMSRAKHLARQALQKQKKNMGTMKTVKESRKSEIVKDVAKKKKEVDAETFVADPVLSSAITKT
jgi:hypothetical protein